MKTWMKKIFLALILVVALYGTGRLYYAFTGGFTISNVTSDLSYDPRWEMPVPSPENQKILDKALNQPYTYLGKGCQSYVFESQDGKYVLKFFKYQRFRPQAWLNMFTFIPQVREYQEEKAVKKKESLDNIFRSWKIAYLQLPKESGLLFVQLNKKQESDPKYLKIKDKLGFSHRVDLNRMEFLLQKKAILLADQIKDWMEKGKEKKAVHLIDQLIAMLISEYEKGIADNDHALMQNTGVIDGHPVHIDVGQFVRNDTVIAPKVYKQEIYDKTYLLHVWLKENYPPLADYLTTRLVDLIGVDYYYMAPYVHKGNVGKIPNQD
jgi:hypothetical protein